MKVLESFLEVLGGVFFSLLTYIPAPLFLLIIASVLSGGSGSGLGGGLAPLFIMLFFGIALLLQLWLTYKFSNKGTVLLGIWLVYPVAFFSYQPLMDFNKAKQQKERRASIKKNAIYYRLKASYRHKNRNTGKMEKIEFDLVGDCHVKYFMKPSADGGAVLMYLPDNVCNQSVYVKKKIPDNYMPFAVWFDDVHDTHFGWGYANEEAYQSARSELKFDGATLTKQNYTQWQAWRKTQKLAFRPVGSIKSPFGFGGSLSDTAPEVKQRLVAKSCYGYGRTPIPNKLRHNIKKLKPKGRKRYWSSLDVRYDKWQKAFKIKEEYFYRLSENTPPSRGVRRHNNEGEIKGRNKGKVALYYPLVFRDKNGAEIQKVLYKEEMKGFVGCTSHWGYREFLYINDILVQKPSDILVERNHYLWLNYQL